MRTTITLCFLLLVTVGIACCGEPLRSRLKSNHNEVGSVHIEEDFEDCALGEFPNKPPWQYHGSKFGSIKVFVTNKGCAVGSRCLRVERCSVSADPLYDAYFGLKPSNPAGYSVLYCQFYLRYSGKDTRLKIYYGVASAFDLAMSSHGALITGVENWKMIAGEESVRPGTWYRVEMRVNYASPATLDIALYEGKDTLPLEGSVVGRELIVGMVAEDVVPNISISNYSPKLFTDPQAESDEYAFFIDDVVLSDRPEVLVVGF